jgi:hypothetical protein
LGEFNQCSAQLQQLYKIFEIPGSEDEFTAYRIFYMIHTLNKHDIIQLIGSLKTRGPCVQHALAIRSAVSTGDYVLFFRLFHETPNMGAYLIDHFIHRERVKAFLKLTKSYRPRLSVEFLTKKLGFIHPDDVTDKSKDRDAFMWIRELDIPIVDGEIDCKSAYPILFQAAHEIESKGVDIKGQIH